MVRLEYSPSSGGGGDLAARLEGAATLDHHQHYQGIVLVLGPTREVVHRVPVLSHLASTRLAHDRQGRALKGVLGGTARGGKQPENGGEIGKAAGGGKVEISGGGVSFKKKTLLTT